MSKIYFIQQGNEGPIKIGISWEVKKRLKDLSVASPFEPIILAVIAGDRGKERKLHRKFKKEHMRGEWFKPSERLMEFIRTLPNNNLSEPIEMDGEKLLTPIELSEVLQFKPERILSMANKGEIPCIKNGGMTYFGESNLEKWLAGLEKNPSASQNPPQTETEKKVVSLRP